MGSWLARKIRICCTGPNYLNSATCRFIGGVGGRSWGAEGRDAGQGATLRERIARLDDASAAEAIRDAFLAFMAGLLGFKAATFDLGCALSVYGTDSLSGVSCQYWFHKGLFLCVTSEWKRLS